MASNGRQWAAISLMAAIIFWSGSNLVAKMASGNIPPGSITFWRWFLAFVVMTPFCLKEAVIKRRIILNKLPYLFVLGALGMVVYQGALYFGAKDTSATNIGLLLGCVPVFTQLFAALLLGEKVTIKQAVGLVLSIVGLLIVISQGQLKGILSLQFNPGDQLIVLGVAGYALYTVLSKRWHLPFSTLASLYVQVSCSVILLVPFALISPSWSLNHQNIALIAYAGIMASVAAPFCWLWGIRILTAAQSTLFFYLIPLITALLSSLFLGENIHGYHLVGGVVAFAGLAVSLIRVPAKFQQNSQALTTS